MTRGRPFRLTITPLLDSFLGLRDLPYPILRSCPISEAGFSLAPVCRVWLRTSRPRVALGD